MRCTKMSAETRRTFLITALRTPIALRRGGLAKIRPEIFAASVVRELLRRTNVSADSLDGVFAGNAVGTGGNIARLMSLRAGFPPSVPAVTIDMQCASAAASISLAFAKIAAGQGDCYLAGGLESVSLQPARTYAVGDPRREALAATGGAYYTAELAPDDLRQDAMLWGAERVMEQEHEWMLPIKDCTRDEGIKPRMNQRLLDRLPPVLGADTLLTAANACRTNDGAAFVLLASERFVREHHLSPEFEILATAAAGVNPDESPRGAMATAEKLLMQQHLVWKDLAAIEFNEAFAVIDVLLERAHPEILDRYNIHGGALAYGHPYGASGAILAIQLLAALRERSGFGLLSIAGAGGLGEAVLVRKERRLIS